MRKKKTPRQKLVAECDRLFSLLVRQESADENGIASCANCGVRRVWRKLQCGHYQSRRYISTRWVLKNAAAQCGGCNAFGSYRGQGVAGEPRAMALYLDRSFGEGTAEMMETVAKRHPWKPTLLELETLRDEMKRTLELNGYVAK